jgi:hypothetical protein
MGKLLNRVGRYVIALPLLILCAIVACEEDPTKTDEDIAQLRMSVYGGNNQTDRVGAMLPSSLVAQVKNLFDTPQPGIEVRFSVVDPGGSVSPASATTDSEGRAHCYFTLGPTVGKQHVKAVVTGKDSVLFTATAVDVGCEEENPSRVCDWRSDRIYITTTSSSLIEGTGSALIEYDPVSEEAVKLYETTEILLDLSFSARGELFVATSHQVFKVDPSSYLPSVHVTFPARAELELKPNSGGILAGISTAGPFAITCNPPGHFDLNLSHSLQYVRAECLVVLPTWRNLFILLGAGPPSYQLATVIWDGRSEDAMGPITMADIPVGAATPVGMCVDSTEAVLFVCFDGNDNYRRVVKLSIAYNAAVTIDDDFVDFYALGGNSQAAGRWGDIAYADGTLYLIDTRNNRLASIDAETGAVDFGGTDYRLSKSGAENERYGIAVRPPYMCAGNP